VNERQCSARVFGERVTNWACQRPGTVERGGKWYCWQHDPDAVKKRDAARTAERERKWQQLEASFARDREDNRRADCFLAMLAALEELERWCGVGMVTGYRAKVLRVITPALEKARASSAGPTPPTTKGAKA